MVWAELGQCLNQRVRLFRLSDRVIGLFGRGRDRFADLSDGFAKPPDAVGHSCHVAAGIDERCNHLSGVFLRIAHKLVHGGGGVSNFGYSASDAAKNIAHPLSENVPQPLGLSLLFGNGG